MENRAIFTIGAKNYLAQAKVLGYSVKKWLPDIDFFILLADEKEGFNIFEEDFNIIEAKTIGIPKYDEMTLKYDVVEYSTSIKPFFLANLLNQGYEKVLYLDPDMVVYSDLKYLFEKLDNYDAIITPHITKPYLQFDGAISEETFLFVGIYNLGFFGVKNSETGKRIVEWWKIKLADQCYGDKEDALHVDQKWMDFLPALYNEKVGIIQHPGVNFAHWNWHERTFKDNGDSFKVDGKDLLIFHFSGLDPAKPEQMAKKQSRFSLITSPEYTRLFTEYVVLLKRYNVEQHQQMTYTYNTFDNGIYILQFQRRIFRGLLSKGYQLTKKPFSIEKDSFYDLLKSSRLLLKNKGGKYNKLKNAYSNYNSMFGKVEKAQAFFKSIIGIKYYFMLMKFLSYHIRFEDQLYLVKYKEEKQVK